MALVDIWWKLFILRSPGPFIRQPDTFSSPGSAPATPMSQRRRLRINQSPAPPCEPGEPRPNYRDQLTASAFQPGFYRPPTEEAAKAPMFQLTKGKASKSSAAIKEETVRMSQASSTAYEGDSELWIIKNPTGLKTSFNELRNRFCELTNWNFKGQNLKLDILL